MYDSYSLLSHCHSTAVALEDFWPAVGSTSFISISLFASLRLLHSFTAAAMWLHVSLTFHYDAGDEGDF